MEEVRCSWSRKAAWLTSLRGRDALLKQLTAGDQRLALACGTAEPH